MSLTQAEHIMATDRRHSRGPVEAGYEDGAAFVIDNNCPLEKATVPINDTGFIHTFGPGGPGGITTKLPNLYWEKRWHGWLGTAVGYRAIPMSFSN